MLLRNYLATAFQHFWKNKTHSFINLIGLALGILCCTFIWMYVRDETGYDAFHKKANRIYRIPNIVHLQGKVDEFASAAYILAPTLKDEFPEVENYVRIMDIGEVELSFEDKKTLTDFCFMSDSTLFEIFDYQFLYGDPGTALKELNSMVLSDETAKRIFGNENPVGKIIQTPNDRFEVTAVIRDNDRSHLKFNAIIPLSRMWMQPYPNMDRVRSGWLAIMCPTYLLFREPIDPVAMARKINETLYPKYVEPQMAAMYGGIKASIEYQLQALPDIHLNSALQHEIKPGGNKAYLYILSVVGLFIILIAGINYVNLATATASQRGREVGMRKVLGAQRGQLMGQFLSETLLLTLLAALTAVVAMQVLLPFFNQLAQKDYSSTFFITGDFWLALAGIVVLLGLLAGSYPALVLSGFEPLKVLKLNRQSQHGSAPLRKALVVLQFTVSIVMIVASLVVFSQIYFMKNKNLGFAREHILSVEMPRDTALLQKKEGIRSELLASPAIEKVSFSNGFLGQDTYLRLFDISKDGEMVQKSMYVIGVDNQFLDLYNIPVVQGQNFTQKNLDTYDNKVIVNQAVVEFMGWDDPIGQKVKLTSDSTLFDVIGVTADFHYASLHHPIEPIVMWYDPRNLSQMEVKVRPGSTDEAITAINQTLTNRYPEYSLSYRFVDETLGQLYEKEATLLKLFTVFTLLAVFIACLGLFGLASYNASVRSREIGIRRVLGATSGNIAGLLSKDFLALLALASVISVPLAWYAMSRWLEGFYYRVNMGAGSFVMAILLAFVLAMLTVGSQTLKSLKEHPVNALRSE
ncbi:MAG: ABC transporter permease [Lewinellaceae bacterium]|nr:ABC transporter permease [Lewinellaceae bacterium]